MFLDFLNDLLFFDNGIFTTVCLYKKSDETEIKYSKIENKKSLVKIYLNIHLS